MSAELPPYQALLIVSFGGPEGPDDVLPFLENVLRGRAVPRERLLAVAEHYQHFGGVSPINAQNRALIAALEQELAAHGPPLPIYWGNRNWHPLLTDALQRMADDGIERALGFFTSAYSSYSSCRQYRENIAAAQAAVGPRAPQVDKLRVYYNHPGFIEPMIERTRAAIERLAPANPQSPRLAFTAHSIPTAMADGCRYVEQLQEACRLIAAQTTSAPWALVYQSRSGAPHQPWLEPDVNDHLRSLAAEGVKQVVVVPVGFISDHLEVLYDLDLEARRTAESLGMKLIRASTVGVDPRFVGMIRELVCERIEPGRERRFLGELGPSHDCCPVGCCPAPQRPAPTAAGRG